MSEKQPPSGFKDLLSNMMARRWYITALVLGGFMFIIGGMFFACQNIPAIISLAPFALFQKVLPYSAIALSFCGYSLSAQ